MKLLKKAFNKFLFFKKKKKITIDEKDKVGFFYLLKKEKTKCEKLQTKLNQEILEEEISDCFSALKEVINKFLAPDEWDRVKDLSTSCFIEQYFKMTVAKKWVLDDAAIKKGNLCIGRILEIYRLQREMQGSLDIESYYGVMSNLKSAKPNMGKLYVRIRDLTKEAEDLIDNVIFENKQMDIDLLVKKISLEVGGLLKEKMSSWKSPSEDMAQCPRMDIDIGILDIRSVIENFKVLQQRLEGYALREYIHKHIEKLEA